MFFSQEYLSEVKEANPLFEVISDYTALERKGDIYIAVCPFLNHNDNDPSLRYYPNKQNAHCFGCNTKIGDSIDFVQEMEGLDFQGAVKFLIERAGLEYPNDESNPKFKRNHKLKEKLNKKAQEFYMNLKDTKKGKKAREYLNSRGITEKLINKFKLGYCDFKYAKLKKGDKDYQFKKFTNRIIFPIFNKTGAVVGFSGRVFPEKEDQYVKYINSSEKNNPLFKKKELLYGFSHSRREIRQKNYFVFVEGYVDLLLLYLFGIRNIGAPMGTNISRSHLGLVKKYTDNIIWFLDGDEAAEKAIKKDYSLFLEQGLNLRIVSAKKGKDPADMALELKDNIEKWVMENSQTPEHFFVHKALAKYNSKKANAKRDAITELKETFDISNKDDLELEVALETLCKQFNLSLLTLKKELGF